MIYVLQIFLEFKNLFVVVNLPFLSYNPSLLSIHITHSLINFSLFLLYNNKISLQKMENIKAF